MRLSSPPASRFRPSSPQTSPQTTEAILDAGTSPNRTVPRIPTCLLKMKLLPTLIASFLIIGISSALPQVSGSGDEFPCPASQPCYNVSYVAEYCANTTDPAVLTLDSFTTTDPIECFCGSDVLEDETGFYAALECGSCADPDAFTTEEEEWLVLWIYTCYTLGEDGSTAALECWNSLGEDGCTPLPDSKAKKLKTKKTKNKMKMF